MFEHTAGKQLGLVFVLANRVLPVRVSLCNSVKMTQSHLKRLIDDVRCGAAYRLEYEVACGVVLRWIRVYANILETMPGETEGGKIALVRVDLASH